MPELAPVTIQILSLIAPIVLLQISLFEGGWYGSGGAAAVAGGD
jgi:uncharacterized membrane protein